MLSTRESRARALAAATAVVVVALSALFAVLRNPTRESVPPPAAPSGRTAFERLNCLSCHSLAGQGEGIPLDRIGARLTRAQLRDWALGSGVAAERLPPTIARLKQQHANDPEIEALLDDLQQLR